MWKKIYKVSTNNKKANTAILVWGKTVVKGIERDMENI